jgi:hypothetical protein
MELSVNPALFGDGTLDKSRFAREPHREPKSKTAAKRRTPLARGKTKEVSDARRGFWHGVMCAKLRAQEPTEFYRCECGDPDCNSQIEGFDEARRFFQPGHVKPRASFNHKGFRLSYTPTLGPDDPDNIVPVSPSCNASEFWNRNQEQPEWSER